MEIPLFFSKENKFCFVYENQYKTTKTIIPVGYDCQPSFLLQHLGLRKESYPFDWMLTNSLYGLKYVHDNLKTDFEFFLKDLKKNEQGHVYAAHYDYALFYHYKTLIEDQKTYQTLQRRANRMLNTFKNKPCVFLYNVLSNYLFNEANVEIFYNSVKDFISLLKSEDELLILLRYENEPGAEKSYCESLVNKLQGLDKVKIVTYSRNTSKYGIWGDTSIYAKLLRQLNVPLQSVYPRIAFLSRPVKSDQLDPTLNDK